MCGMVVYSDDHQTYLDTIFPPKEIAKPLGEVVADADLSKRVHLFPAGAGKQAGKLTLNYGSTETGSGSSFAYGHETDVDAHRYKHKVVDVVTLDEKVLPLVHPESMVVLKIDTQGWEMDVLRGAAELLRTQARSCARACRLAGHLPAFVASLCRHASGALYHR